MDVSHGFAPGHFSLRQYRLSVFAGQSTDRLHTGACHPGKPVMRGAADSSFIQEVRQEQTRGMYFMDHPLFSLDRSSVPLFQIS